ncbi:DUF4253 domain-containing protein [Mangrovivirga sp. M17]|uniref:DUF4253 domain-containing protein n=1 Tax=Mangrovivirga halotolerans TaxID=2993936 RepID=A0ABT3RPL2_9BACT|nr:DUF4253 domain-containing protein [Mangrovivirga halotolerans]MCX2743304.1 DUF4253 domain-containing protein [Mangrovivirga halotolerans]
MKLNKKIFSPIWIIVSFVLVNACINKKGFSESEKSMLTNHGYDPELISEVREFSDSEITEKRSAEEYWAFKDSTNYVRFNEKDLVGLKFNESSENATTIVNSLQNKFNQNGYFIYVSESNFGYSPDEITILKTKDKFDILRFEGTSGINYDIFVEDIIEKLSAWDKQYGIKIFGAGFDFIEGEYQKIPGDVKEHAQEVYEFCPDIVDQGTGSVEELEKEMENSKYLFLWWD